MIKSTIINNWDDEKSGLDINSKLSLFCISISISRSREKRLYIKNYMNYNFVTRLHFFVYKQHIEFYLSSSFNLR